MVEQLNGRGAHQADQRRDHYGYCESGQKGCSGKYFLFGAEQDADRKPDFFE